MSSLKKSLIALLMTFGVLIPASIILKAKALSPKPAYMPATNTAPQRSSETGRPKQAINQTLSVSKTTILNNSWTFYKTQFMSDNQRVVSNNYGGTITEGQSYALLKAVWMNDKDTFDKTWQWTKTHMQRPHDHLLGWHWGQKPDGTLGLIDIENAPDADEDIAYALLLAGEQWQRPDYIMAGKLIINDLWKKNVVEGSGHYYLTAGTWEGFYEDGVTVNPSYMAPYVYRKFAVYDAVHPWNKLADDVYPVLEKCSALRDDRLPPNFCKLNVEAGEAFFSYYQGEDLKAFGYDATRVFWRMAMDARFGSEKARQFLARKEVYLDKKAAALLETDNTLKDYLKGSILATKTVLHPERAGDYFQAFQSDYHNYQDEAYWVNSYDDYLHSVLWLHLYSVR